MDDPWKDVPPPPQPKRSVVAQQEEKVAKEARVDRRTEGRIQWFEDHPFPVVVSKVES